MLVSVAAAVIILLLVALPKFREGAPFLTEQGEEALAEARRRTRALAAQARERAAEAAQQAAEQAKAARERVATLSSGDEDDEARDDADRSEETRRDDDRRGEDRDGDDDTQLAAPAPAAERVQMPVPPAPGPAEQATDREPQAEATNVRVAVRDEQADVRDGVRGDGPEGDHTDDVIDLRDSVATVDGIDGHLNGRLTEKRGAHRKLNDITFGEPLPGPRHGR